MVVNSNNKKTKMASRVCGSGIKVWIYRLHWNYTLQGYIIFLVTVLSGNHEDNLVETCQE